MEEQKAKSVTKNYYNALKDEGYGEALEQLYLYDYTEDRHPTDGTTLSEEEARKFYLWKIDYLKEQNYKIKGYEIENIRYEDGHTFFLKFHLMLSKMGKVLNGQKQ
ncbi:hypothetical protein ACIQZI_13205 [Peribacillus sp. NPDC096379]|uniref:hypothetical protein n=1 Tax=Peribacillus sp. NPDC096379 TaxID=3364393 RepID=UPI00380B0D48